MPETVTTAPSIALCCSPPPDLHLLSPLRTLVRNAAPTEAATVVFSELVANAIVHGQAPIHIAVAQDGDHTVVAVHDGSVAPPRRHGDPWRGLDLVTSLSDEVAWCETSTGKWIWARLPQGQSFSPPAIEAVRTIETTWNEQQHTTAER